MLAFTVAFSADWVFGCPPACPPAPHGILCRTVVERVGFIIRMLTLLECYIDTVVESVAFIIVVLTLIKGPVIARAIAQQSVRR